MSILYYQKASRIIQNLQHEFLNMGLTLPPTPFDDGKALIDNAQMQYFFFKKISQYPLPFTQILC